MNARPSVTAIIATYNRADLLREALDSIYAQEGLGTQFDVEVIVVDDASLDHTPQVAARYPNVRFIRLPVNRGHSAARNVGINYSSGTYVAFLDDDDVWLPRKLSSQVAVLEAHPEAGLAYSQFIIGSAPHGLVFPDRHAPSGSVFNQMLFVNLCGIPAVPLVRRQALKEVGGFGEDLATVEDYDLWLRLSFHVPFIFVPGPVAVYRQSPQGNMLTMLRNGEYDVSLGKVIERALALLPDTEEAKMLKQHVRANREFRIGTLLGDHTEAWERLRAAVAMWPGLALHPANRLSVAHIIAAHAASSDDSTGAARRLWKEINDLQAMPGRGGRTAMRRLLAAVYWEVGVIEGKGIGRSVDRRTAAGAILRSIIMDPVAPHRWVALLGFLARRSFAQRTA